MSDCQEITHYLRQLKTEAVMFDFIYQNGRGDLNKAMAQKAFTKEIIKAADPIRFSESEIEDLKKVSKLMALPDPEKAIKEKKVLLPSIKELSEAESFGFTKPMLVPATFSRASELGQHLHMALNYRQLPGLVIENPMKTIDLIDQAKAPEGFLYYLVMTESNTGLLSHSINCKPSSAKKMIESIPRRFDLDVSLRPMNIREYIMLQAWSLAQTEELLDMGRGCFFLDQKIREGDEDYYLYAFGIQDENRIKFGLAKDKRFHNWGTRYCVVPKALEKLISQSVDQQVSK